ncbi:hypothetical protein SAMN05518846_108128 [Brevibacillus centrosporus]|uniref:Uncharacterized protein n=1 Tax=Brevibacillus centrosporus TaxID=54910 RepID=A0A1I3WID9_9BACL|nr:hypothetical protein SAMN05518846_108128 [Brevibacillus centrosporus]
MAFPLPVLRLLRTVKFVKQLHQSTLLDARNIGARNAQFASDFPLGLLFVLIQSESPDDHFFFPIVENMDVLINLVRFQLQLHRIHYFVGFCAEDVDEGDFINPYFLSVFSGSLLLL